MWASMLSVQYPLLKYRSVHYQARHSPRGKTIGEFHGTIPHTTNTMFRTDAECLIASVNIWTCFLIILDQGLRKEDVGEALDKLPWPYMTNAEGECEECPMDQVSAHSQPGSTPDRECQ